MIQDLAAWPSLTESEEKQHLFVGGQCHVCLVPTKARGMDLSWHHIPYFNRFNMPAPLWIFWSIYQIADRQQLLFQGPGIILEPNARVDCSLSKWRVTSGWISQSRPPAYDMHSSWQGLPQNERNKVSLLAAELTMWKNRDAATFGKRLQCPVVKKIWWSITSSTHNSPVII